jgi:hypothetical protein
VSIFERSGEMTAARVPSLAELDRKTFLGFSLTWGMPANALPALVQMLEAEGERSRLLLVQLLDRASSDAAAVALAQRAIFDLSARVRQAAVGGLMKRSPEKYRQVLLDGSRHPWPPVADFAAEALAAVQDADAIEHLQALRTEPDPRLITTADKPPRVRELVRINHLRNCLLCHAPAAGRNDRVVGVVPTPGQPLPLSYYAARGSLLVRADVTYLRQDFSAALAVEKAAPWPTVQRFDFLVRTRPASAEEARQLRDPAASSPQREAVLFALHELGRTGSE